MSDQSGDHVHWYNDGRGRRLVTLDGEPVRRCIYCDAQAGIAVVYCDPVTFDAEGRIDTHPVWGEISVRLMADDEYEGI